MEAWRISFLPSPETFHMQNAPLRPLLVKEGWEILSGRALWTMLLLMCPLIGYSFFQAVSLYGEASAAGLQSPVMASSLSPRSEEHTSELQSRQYLVCRLLLEKKKKH